MTESTPDREEAKDARAEVVYEMAEAHREADNRRRYPVPQPDSEGSDDETARAALRAAETELQQTKAELGSVKVERAASERLLASAEAELARLREALEAADDLIGCVDWEDGVVEGDGPEDVADERDRYETARAALPSKGGEG